LFPVGFAYLDFDRTKVPHLWFVIAAPHHEPDDRVIVSITSDGPHIVDRSCELAPSDHEFITHRSFVLFRKASITTISALSSLTARGEIQVKPAAKPALIDRIREAALQSAYVGRNVKPAIRDCWWTP
jgi:hypothetical protein